MTCIAEVRLLDPEYNLAIDAVGPVTGIALLFFDRGVDNTSDKFSCILRVTLEAFFNRDLLLDPPRLCAGNRQKYKGQYCKQCS